MVRSRSGLGHPCGIVAAWRAVWVVFRLRMKETDTYRSLHFLVLRGHAPNARAQIHAEASCRGGGRQCMCVGVGVVFLRVYKHESCLSLKHV